MGRFRRPATTVTSIRRVPTGISRESDNALICQPERLGCSFREKAVPAAGLRDRVVHWASENFLAFEVLGDPRPNDFRRKRLTSEVFAG